MRGLVAVIPFLLIFSLSACHTRHAEKESMAALSEAVGPVVLHTSLEDTLSPSFLAALHLEKVDGLKLKYRSGKQASYFAYIADPDAVLREVAQSPFSKYLHIADTVCRKIDYRTVDLLRQEVHTSEVEICSFFWDADAAEFEAYECLRGPVRHTLLISRATRNIVHRVELTV